MLQKPVSMPVSMASCSTADHCIAAAVISLLELEVVSYAASLPPCCNSLAMLSSSSTTIDCFFLLLTGPVPGTSSVAPTPPKHGNGSSGPNLITTNASADSGLLQTADSMVATAASAGVADHEAAGGTAAVGNTQIGSQAPALQPISQLHPLVKDFKPTSGASPAARNTTAKSANPNHYLKNEALTMGRPNTASSGTNNQTTLASRGHLANHTTSEAATLASPAAAAAAAVPSIPENAVDLELLNRLKSLILARGADLYDGDSNSTSVQLINEAL